MRPLLNVVGSLVLVCVVAYIIHALVGFCVVLGITLVGLVLFAAVRIVRTLAHGNTGRAERQAFIPDACAALGLKPPTRIKRSSREGGDLWVTEGTFEGIQVGLSLTEHGWVTAWALLEGAVPPGLKLMREPPFAGLARRAGAQDIQLGDPVLDKRFMISGETESVRALLDQKDVRSSLFQLCRKYKSTYVENRRIEVFFVQKGPKVRWNEFRFQGWEAGTRLEQIREGLDGVVQFALAINAANVGAMPSEEEQSAITDDPEERFSLQLKEIQKGRSTLWLIAMLNALVFYGMFRQSGDGTHQLTIAYDWGASFGPSVADGQWWRLLTANYVHFGFMHILGNMLFLLYVGLMIEALLGRRAFFFLYTATGIFGALLSVWLNYGPVGGGASGAVFGVYGAGAVFVFPRGDIVPVRVMRKHASVMFIFLLYQLEAVPGSSGVDHLAHLGGFLSGFALALVLSHRLDAEGFASRPARLRKSIAWTGLVLVLGVICFPDRPDDLAELRARASELGPTDPASGALPVSARNWVNIPTQEGWVSNPTRDPALLVRVIRSEIMTNHEDWLIAAEPLRSTLTERWSFELEWLGFSVSEMLQGWILVGEGLEAGDDRVEEGLAQIENAREWLYHP